MRIRRAEIARGLANWRYFGPLMLFVFGAMTLGGLGFASLAERVLPPMVALGFVYLGCLPSTVQSATSYTSLAEGNVGPEAHAYSRPPQVEGEATNRAIMIADMAGVPLYVVHVSCEQAHEAIRRARQKGMRVYGEPLIQHLTLDESEYFNTDWDHAARRVMSPPFRNKQHQDSLWAGLQSGSLSVVATDHCAFTTEQKRFGLDSFAKIPNGTGGLEDRMPMLWTYGVATGRLTMNEFVAVTSTNIAKILNIYPKKGAVLVGADADLVVWDPKRSKTISAKTQQSSIDYNVFEGKEVTGLPRYTLTRGYVAIEESAVKTREGHGKFVKREPFPAVSKALSTWKELTAPRAVTRCVSCAARVPRPRRAIGNPGCCRSTLTAPLAKTRPITTTSNACAKRSTNSPGRMWTLWRNWRRSCSARPIVRGRVLASDTCRRC